MAIATATESSEQTVERLTRSGPGTPMGDLLRRYWQPIGLSTDVSVDGAPMSTRLLGEDLVLFRDSDGKPGLLARKCAHRCADLSYGRVENGGLRCIYHGWLYDRHGRCLEQPGEPGGGEHRDDISQLAYPCVDLADTIWAYMGPGDPPQLPNHPALLAPSEYRICTRWYTSCNFLQGNEGNLDPVHTAYLHRFTERPDNPAEAAINDLFQADTAPRLSVYDTPAGFSIVAERTTEDAGRKILRVTNFIMPNGGLVNGFDTPLGPGGATLLWHVPIDDTHHWRFEYTFHSKKAVDKAYIEDIFATEKLVDDVPTRNVGNRHLQNREEMDSSTFAGLGHCIPVHDLVIIEGQGKIHDHSKEHLVTSDVAIVRARRLLLEGLAAVEAGQEPRGVVRNGTGEGLRHAVAGTDTVDVAVSNEDFCRSLERAELYALAPL